MSRMRRVLRRLSHSLTARLLLIFFVGSVAYGYAARYAFTLFQDTDYLRRIVGAHIALHSEYILNDIGSPPDIKRAEVIVSKIPVDIRIVGPDMNWSSTPDFYPLDKIPFGPLSLLGLGEASHSEVEAWARKIENVQFARYDDHALVRLQDGAYQIIFASPRIRETPRQDYTTLIFSLVGALVLFFCYLAVRWVFRPIGWMQEGATRIGRGDLEYRIPIVRNDELGDLSREFNEMAADVQGMLDAKRQLMLAISHELRSPLTRTKVALEMVEDEPARSSILDDVNEMERLISDLLESEALGTRHAILRRESVDLGELMHSIVDTDFAQRGDRIRLQLAPQLPRAELDVTRIRLLMRNLIDNALRHNGDSSKPIEVRVGAGGGNVLIDVIDHGAGISAEHLERVTEPFYRADPARSRATGGVGLGLYLCRRVVEAHGGDIKIQSQPGDGVHVAISLPQNA